MAGAPGPPSPVTVSVSPFNLSAMTETRTLDPEKTEAFAGKLVDTLNKGALSLMISIGHRVGLFDAMDGMEPSTSGAIAEKAGLNERYVREWLGALVTGGMIEYNADTSTYLLPPEHAGFLTRRAGADNLAVFMQYVPVLGQVEDDIVGCFRRGGGVPYSRFPRFHAVMAEDSGQSVLSSLESHILPLVPGLTQKLEQGIDVLDVGCGSGRIVNKLAALFPASRFTGLDLSREAVDAATREASERGLSNTRFVVQDLSDFHVKAVPEAFDWVTTFDAVHDQAKPMNVLKGIFTTMKSDGVYLMQDISGTGHLDKDIDHPIGPFLYAISTMHCMTVSLAQDGEGLGAMWGEEKTREYLRKAGFHAVETKKLSHDIQNNWYVVRKRR